MDPLRFCLAIGPLAVYLLAIGLINLGRRPLLVSGTRDTLALALGVSGLVLIGPVELLLPAASIARFGWTVWLLLLGLYTMGVTMFILTQSPRMHLYNITLSEAGEVLTRLSRQVDPEARWVGQTLVLPTLELHLKVDHFAPLRNVTLTSITDLVPAEAWYRFQAQLAGAVSKSTAANHAHGIALLLIGTILLVITSIEVVSHPQEIARSLYDMLWFDS